MQSARLLLLAALLVLLAALACGGEVAAPLPQAPDADATLDGGADEGADAGVIDAPAGQWAWLDVPGSRCADGQPTGVGVNLVEGAEDVLIFLQGGGACWDANTCFILKSSIHIEQGYTRATFEREGERSAPIFDRSNVQNVFKDASYVFVPYCTGDLHAGDKTGDYELLGQRRAVHHHGAKNIEALLARLGPTLASAKRVWLVGVSAGGYGVQLNYHRFAAALPHAEVHALADGSPMVTPWGGRQHEFGRAWALSDPPGCAGCATDYPKLLSHLSATYPAGRFGLLTFDADAVISVYFHYPLDGTFRSALSRLLQEVYDPSANARYFQQPGTDHVMIGGFYGRRAADGTLLSDWVRGWALGEPSWRSVAR
jgi:hypothetical protein